MTHAGGVNQGIPATLPRTPGIAPLGTGRPSPLPRTPGTGDFDRMLDGAMGASRPVRFSAHAADRVRSRGIHLTPGDLDRLARAVDLAESRGGRESLVLSPSLAYVVNVPARTVVTALSGDQARGSVFTQIDSAVVL